MANPALVYVFVFVFLLMYGWVSIDPWVRDTIRRRFLMPIVQWMVLAAVVTVAVAFLYATARNGIMDATGAFLSAFAGDDAIDRFR